MPQGTRTVIKTQTNGGLKPTVKKPYIVLGVATLPERKNWFEERTLPNLMDQASEVHIFVDNDHEGLVNAFYAPIQRRRYKKVFVSSAHQWGRLGDTGKFQFFREGYQTLTNVNRTGGYFFSIDDDLEYPPTYFSDLISWMQAYDNKVVVSLHGSNFGQMPIRSYYKDKFTFACLGDVLDPQRTLFPGTGALAFPLDLLQPDPRTFLLPNMADIWFGLELQRKKIPAIVVPHKGDYLTYNSNLPIGDTIWGKDHARDFLHTAVINQFSLDPGYEVPGLIPARRSPDLPVLERREAADPSPPEQSSTPDP